MHFQLSHLLALAPLVASHTTFTNLYVDGVNQGDGVCVRMNPDAEKCTYPIEPASSKDIACGVHGEKGVKRICPAEATSLLTFEFREWTDGSKPGSAIDPSHKGPCAVYMKHVDDASADNNAAGDGWFKIWEMGYDESAGKWCTEKLNDNKGLLSAHIPEGLKGGYYLVRPELLALHATQDDPADPQFYTGCAQVFVKGSDNGVVPEGVHIGEGTYDLSNPALTFNIYESPMKLPYPRVGPKVWEGAGSKARREQSTKLVQGKGLKPEGCILERDDWCGYEVPAYDNEDGCWESSSKCWDQCAVCWETTLPTGGASCQIWEDKCNALDDACNGGDFHGPPNKGKDLTPEPKKPLGSLEPFALGSSKRSERSRRSRF
ncbi:hypothetical protein N8T08_009307 [Aspergillus melleus]|uniref:Uncharacterized protein n=1 Tax=Aspergillus melleus TaxID=138277 RepID=A0ACC3ATI0_9EURO|nr:hypothetical protein N8T08_009307 [Aspergillus melleus]